MTLASDDHGCITAVPAANDNIPYELRALGAAIGKWPEGVLPDCDRPHWHPSDDNLPPVVAFTGLAGAGKSTATRYLVDRHGYTLVKFAGPLKDMMRALGMGNDEIEGDLKEVAIRELNGKTPRYAMQTLGTEWGRKCMGEDFWVGQWLRHVEEIFANDGRVVVDDCRFPNEAKAIRKLGGDIYKLVGRGGIPGQHESERGCGDEDLVIANDNTPEDLFKKVEDALRRYG
jgi:hypothetical protein